MTTDVAEVKKRLCAEVLAGRDPDWDWDSSCEYDTDWQALEKETFANIKLHAHKAKQAGWTVSVLLAQADWQDRVMALPV
jgi:hypothetical protein